MCKVMMWSLEGCWWHDGGRQCIVNRVSVAEFKQWWKLHRSEVKVVIVKLDTGDSWSWYHWDRQWHKI